MKNYQNKYDFKQSVENVLDIYLYSAIKADGYDWWSGEEIKSDTSARFFKEELEKYPTVSEIRLYVNSEGGSVKEAMGIRSLLSRHPAKKVAYIDGWAASAASFIITICDDVKMFSSSMQMLHNMWMVAAGNAKELRQMADAMDKMMEGNRQAYLSKSGDKLTEDKLIELMEAESWLTAKDCMEYGLADEIIQERSEEMDQLQQKFNTNIIQSVTMDQVKSMIQDALTQSVEPEDVTTVEGEEIQEDVGTKPQELTNRALIFMEKIIEKSRKDV